MGTGEAPDALVSDLNIMPMWTAHQCDSGIRIIGWVPTSAQISLAGPFRLEQEDHLTPSLHHSWSHLHLCKRWGLELSSLSRYPYMQTHTHLCTHIHTHSACTHTCMHVHVCTLISKHTYICTHTQRTRTHTHARGHTPTYSCPFPLEERSQKPHKKAAQLWGSAQNTPQMA